MNELEKWLLDVTSRLDAASPGRWVYLKAIPTNYLNMKTGKGEPAPHSLVFVKEESQLIMPGVSLDRIKFIAHAPTDLKKAVMIIQSLGFKADTKEVSEIAGMSDEEIWKGP